MLNKHFPPADDEWNVCSHCKGAGLLFTNPANPSQRPYRKCLDCAGMGKVAQRRPRVQQGLDPNTQPGNSTSMGESDQMGDMGDMVPGDNGWQPRVDPYTQDKIEKTQMEQLDQEARRLQRGMRGLDQFAGAWKSVSQVDLNEGEDYEDYYGFTGRGACDYGHFSPDVRRLPTGERSAVNVCQDHYAQEAEYRNMRQQMNPHADWSIESWDELEPSDDPEEMKVPIRRNAANERREEKKRQWAGESQAYELQKEQYESQVAEYGEQVKHYEGVTLPAWEQEQASKPPEKFQECSDCRGTGQGYGAGGTCRNCRGSGLEEKGPDRPPPPPRKPVAPTRPSSRPGTATGLRRNDRLDRRYRQKPTGKYYPNQTITCRTCSGSKEVENYKGEKEECYRCRGEGTEAHRDPRDLFEHHLENYSGKKDLVPIDPSTGVWEDVDQYHVRLHDTDILNYHKEKPYVSIDMGDDQPWVSYMRGRDGPRERMHYNEWDTMTTHDRLRRHLPNGISVGHEEVRTGKHPHERNEMVVKTPEASYLMRQGITINHETGLAVDPDTGKEDTTGKLFACKECHRYRETQEEMDKHQKRHDAYRKAYEKSPWRKCGDCNGQGTTAPWHTECKSCKGVGIDSENLPCEGCRGSGISYHKGADPKINWEYDPESGRRKVQITNPGACGTCGGSGKLEKGKPVEL